MFRHWFGQPAPGDLDRKVRATVSAIRDYSSRPTLQGSINSVLNGTLQQTRDHHVQSCG